MAKKASVKSVTDQMKTLGVYKPEFDRAIARYVELANEYTAIYKVYKEMGYQYEAEDGKKKSPIVQTLESLRRDLLSQEEALGLNPRGLMRLKADALNEKKASKKDSLV